MKIHEYNEMMAYLTRPSYVSGGRVGFKDAGIVNDIALRYNLDDTIKQQLKALYESISNYKKTNDPSVVQKRILSHHQTHNDPMHLLSSFVLWNIG